MYIYWFYIIANQTGEVLYDYSHDNYECFCIQLADWNEVLTDKVSIETKVEYFDPWK